jgi:hypothetical protein
MSATGFDSLISAVDSVLSILRSHKAATISNRRFKQAFDRVLDNWTSIKFVVDLGTGSAIDDLIMSAMVTAESTNPSVRLLNSKCTKVRKLARTLKLSRHLPTRYAELKAKSGAIPSAYMIFLDEAFDCWINGTLRAAIVTAWCALEAKLFDIYKSKWTIADIKKLVPEANRKAINVHDDLTYLSDDALLTGLRDASVLGSAEYRLLAKVCKTYRDLAAHASLKRGIYDDEVSASLAIIIEFLTKSI